MKEFKFVLEINSCSVTVFGVKLEIFSIKLFELSSVICMFDRSDPSLFVLIVGGRRELPTDKFSVVTIDGAGGGEGKISPTGTGQEGGPEVHPTQLHVTLSQLLKRKQ